MSTRNCIYFIHIKIVKSQNIKKIVKKYWIMTLCKYGFWHTQNKDIDGASKRPKISRSALSAPRTECPYFWTFENPNERYVRAVNWKRREKNKSFGNFEYTANSGALPWVRANSFFESSPAMSPSRGVASESSGAPIRDQREASRPQPPKSSPKCPETRSEAKTPHREQVKNANYLSLSCSKNFCSKRSSAWSKCPNMAYVCPGSARVPTDPGHDSRATKKASATPMQAGANRSPASLGRYWFEATTPCGSCTLWTLPDALRRCVRPRRRLSRPKSGHLRATCLCELSSFGRQM